MNNFILFFLLLLQTLCLSGQYETEYSSYENSSYAEQTLCKYIEKGNFYSIPSYMETHSISLEELSRAGKKCKNAAVLQAVTATEKMLSLPSISPKLKKALLTIALFAQTDATKAINSSKHYWPKQVFGLELEADLSTGKLFIHLPSSVRYRLGSGRKKIVTKIIVYDVYKPKLAAYGSTSFDPSAEIFALKSLQNTPQILSSIGFLHHIDPNTGKNVYGIVTTLCNEGSLANIINHGNYLSFEEKLCIAKDCITGLEAMHSKGFVHRDIHLRNFFLYSKKNTLRACIGDFGRTILIKKAHQCGAQGHLGFLAPEGIFHEDMNETDYILSDLFAYGTAMWKLFYGKMPLWSSRRFPHQSHLKKQERYNLLRNAILQEHKNLRKQIRHYPKKSFHSRLAKLLIKWTNPDPKKRGTSAQAKEEITQIVKMCRNSKYLSTDPNSIHFFKKNSFENEPFEKGFLAKNTYKPIWLAAKNPLELFAKLETALYEVPASNYASIFPNSMAKAIDEGISRHNLMPPQIESVYSFAKGSLDKRIFL